MTPKHNWFIVLLLFSGVLPAHAADRGQVQFNTLCVNCHGPQGYGNSDKNVSAPAIAGLPEWYILHQLEKFQAGGRGKHPADDAGNRMRMMARTLRGDDAKLVAHYVAGLKPQVPENTLHGDAEKGKAYFAVCSACHGPNGDGNQDLHAPPLKIGSDWYLVRQLGNFKKKWRAYDVAKDPNGATMAPMAATLADEQAMKDVISYVQSLK